jgi:hypothetical protein
MVGLGVKLAALRPEDAQEEDYQEAIASAFRDIKRLTDIDFAGQVVNRSLVRPAS